jgi:hypothetical protein
MATKFIKGQNVKLAAVIPQGAVEKLRMDEDGNFFYMIQWTDASGQVQQRWFPENDFVEA